eukprot:764584-Hanusia_phi.AAC.1
MSTEMRRAILKDDIEGDYNNNPFNLATHIDVTGDAYMEAIDIVDVPHDYDESLGISELGEPDPVIENIDNDYRDTEEIARVAENEYLLRQQKYRKDYYEKNKERIKATQKEWYEKNKQSKYIRKILHRLNTDLNYIKVIKVTTIEKWKLYFDREKIEWRSEML